MFCFLDCDLHTPSDTGRSYGTFREAETGMYNPLRALLRQPPNDSHATTAQQSTPRRRSTYAIILSRLECIDERVISSGFAVSEGRKNGAIFNSLPSSVKTAILSGREETRTLSGRNGMSRSLLAPCSFRSAATRESGASFTTRIRHVTTSRQVPRHCCRVSEYPVPRPRQCCRPHSDRRATPQSCRRHFRIRQTRKNIV